MIMKINGACIQVNDRIRINLLRRRWQRCILAQNLVCRAVYIVDKGLLARKKHNGKKTSSLTLKCLSLSILIVYSSTSKRLTCISINIVRYKKIALLNIICTTKLFPEPLSNLVRKLYKLNVSVSILLKTPSKIAGRSKLSMSGLRVCRNFTQSTLHI